MNNNQSEDKQDLLSHIVSQFYYSGDEQTKYILLYLCFKFKFISGPTIILCKNLAQMYKVWLFLTRCKIQQCQLINPQSPKSLRRYTFQVFNQQLLSTIIVTPEFFEDLNSGSYHINKKNVGKGIRRLENLIIFDSKAAKSEYFEFFQYFKSKSFHIIIINKGNPGIIISFFEQIDSDQNELQQIIEGQETYFKNPNLKIFPLSKDEIEAFRYRISNLVGSITWKQIKQQQMIDFLSQLLKSSKLKSYYEKNETEKKIILEKMNRLSAQLNKFAIRLYEDIPEYLYPEFVKNKQKLVDFSKPVQNRIRIKMKSRDNENFVESLRNRIEKNVKYQPTLGIDHVIKKVEKEGNRYMNINMQNEDPDIVGPDSLKPVSGRKMWKIMHKKSLKSRSENRREKKVKKYEKM